MKINFRANKVGLVERLKLTIDKHALTALNLLFTATINDIESSIYILSFEQNHPDSEASGQLENIPCIGFYPMSFYSTKTAA